MLEMTRSQGNPAGYYIYIYIYVCVVYVLLRLICQEPCRVTVCAVLLEPILESAFKILQTCFTRLGVVLDLWFTSCGTQGTAKIPITSKRLCT